MSHKKLGQLFLAGVLLLLLMGGVYFFITIDSLRDPDTWRRLTESYPILTPFLVVGLIVVEVVLAPIPGSFLPIVSGYLFGTIEGTLYSWSGNVIGSFIAFYLARTFGRSLAEKIVKKTTLDFYDSFLHRKQHIIWFMYLLPFFPVDIISVSIGLSSFSFKRFARIVMIGMLPGMFLLNYLGDRIYESGAASIFAILSFLIVIVIIYQFKKEWKLIK